MCLQPTTKTLIYCSYRYSTIVHKTKCDFITKTLRVCRHASNPTPNQFHWKPGIVLWFIIRFMWTELNRIKTIFNSYNSNHIRCIWGYISSLKLFCFFFVRAFANNHCRFNGVRSQFFWFSSWEIDIQTLKRVIWIKETQHVQQQQNKMN